MEKNDNSKKDRSERIQELACLVLDAMMFEDNSPSQLQVYMIKDILDMERNAVDDFHDVDDAIMEEVRQFIVGNY